MPDEAQRRDSLGPLIEGAARSRHVRLWAIVAGKWLVGLAASGALATGGLKVVTWATTRDGIVEQNLRIAELQKAVGLPRTEPEAFAEKALRIRVTELEAAIKANSHITGEQGIYERMVSVMCASAEPRASKRAAVARACVLEYRELIKGGMTPRAACDKTLQTAIPRATYD